MTQPGFPLADAFRRITERLLDAATEQLDAASDAVERAILDEPNPNDTVLDADALVARLIAAAAQVERCRLTLQIDDQARLEAGEPPAPTTPDPIQAPVA